MGDLGVPTRHTVTHRRKASNTVNHQLPVRLTSERPIRVVVPTGILMLVAISVLRMLMKMRREEKRSNVCLFLFKVEN